jgi:hypothetical protein
VNVGVLLMASAHSVTRHLTGTGPGVALHAGWRRIRRASRHGYNACLPFRERCPAVLLLASVFKAFSEILALSLIGQGILWLIAGKSRETNVVYRMFAIVTRPVFKLARWISPRLVLDRHVWMVAVLIVVVVWIFAGQEKLKLCMSGSIDDPLCVEIKQGLERRLEK